MRPRFHFAPASGWINDPHGIAVHDGAYHAFYQYVPGATAWAAACSWGHAVGPDLLTLTEVAPALAPGDGDDGVWTGCLVPGDPARIFYTAIDLSDLEMGRVRIATSDDETWTTWTKGAVVVDAPTEPSLSAFRDPFVLADGDGWLMLVGAGLTDGAGAVLAYRSDDLEQWRYEGVMLSSGETGWRGVWECPQLIEIDGRAVLLFSINDAHVGYDVRYAVGSRDGARFEVTAWGVLTYGPAPYAPTAFRDEGGRHCLTFWLRDIVGDGWAGAHSIPYRLDLDGDLLVAAPHDDVSRYAVISPDRMPGAGIVSWSARDDDVLRIGSSVELQCAEELVIRVGADEWRMPRGEDVRIVVDGPVLEVSSTAGVFAAPVPAREQVEVTADGKIAVCALER